MKKIKIVATICALMMAVGLSVLPTVPVGAVNVVSDSCEFNPYSAICKGQNETIQPIIIQVVDILLFIVGIIAVIMIIIGAFRYTLSGGDSKALTDAKNTILYAVIGLAVAFSSYAVVHWVVGLFN